MADQAAQPPMSAAYAAPSNPVETHASETTSSSSSAGTSGTATTRGPSSQNPNAQGQPAYGLPQGVHSAPGPIDSREKANTSSTTTSQDNKQNDSVDAEEQIAPFGEGSVAGAVERKSGSQLAAGQKVEEVHFDDFASGIERKKQEQAEAREAVKAAREAGEDVDGGAGGRRGGVQV